MSRRHGFVVELLGPPGSGKSTLATELAEIPGVCVVKDHAHEDLPALAWAAVRAWQVLPSAPAEVSRSRWSAWAGRLGAARRVTERRLAAGASTVVLDQGPAYTLGRMLEARRTARGHHWWWRRSADCAGLLDLLVVLDADTTILSRRLHVRSKAHPADDWDDDEVVGYLQHERDTCRDVADVLERQGTAVRRLRTDQMPVADQVSAVTEALYRASAEAG